ncbi:MAG: hypothetical protein COA78_00595 [Blastopirellula sp.]|nr:MAG: hypothetical protein COA78_00595 [Blastopirellula sp.]
MLIHRGPKGRFKGGAIGLEVPTAMGGLGGSFTLKARVVEEMARHCFAFTFSRPCCKDRG